MNKPIELLAPGGDLDSIKAAVIAGADAIYCGLDRFNARNRAANIRFEDLNGIIRLAHAHDCQVFLTLNILMTDSEIPAMLKLLNKVVTTDVDGIIIQDSGLLYLVSRYFGSLKIHASTQLTTHNAGQIRYLKKLNTTRVNLARELSIPEIRELAGVCREQDMLTEVFVHGSYCICISGLCYMSSVQSGNSGNRGRCSQPCRDRYQTTEMGKDFPLNLKDNSAWDELQELIDAGVGSLKIEGRIKKFHYVYAITAAWRNHIDRLFAGDKTGGDKQDLYSVFNRGFSNGYLKGNISSDMFIDNPRDHSAIYRAEQLGGQSAENLDTAKGEIYDERTALISGIEEKINALQIPKEPLVIRFPVTVPKLQHHARPEIKPALSVLIRHEADADLCRDISGSCWYSLPEGFRHEGAELLRVFRANPHLLPWFPAMLIGADYQSAIQFLEQLNPSLIVTNNTGIAFEAMQRGIPWIAGPYLNTINSWSLLSLKENYSCSGAFISNEISKVQMKGLKKPADFDLYYSIFHPVQLMTGRQCFFQSVTGCAKDQLDETCIRDCIKTASITNLKQERIIIEKSKGRFPALFHGLYYLNTESVNDFRDLFTGFLIDLSDIGTETQVHTGKAALIAHFEDLLRGNPQSAAEINTLISPTTHSSYQQGI